MFTFDITKFLPRFILNDKTGYALAKAIQAGLQMMNDTIADGVKCIYDVNSMPEWRLDEMAWEYNIPYDNKASVEMKRVWVGNAFSLSRIYGTPEGVIQYLLGYFDEAEIKEFWEYSGSPFHFRVNVKGAWTQQKEDWAVKAVLEAKNVRSILDKITIRMPVPQGQHDLYAGSALHGISEQTFDKAEMPDLNDNYLEDGNGDVLMDGFGVALTTI